MSRSRIAWMGTVPLLVLAVIVVPSLASADDSSGDPTASVNLLSAAENQEKSDDGVSAEARDDMIEAVEFAEAWDRDSEIIRWPEAFRSARDALSAEFPSDFAAAQVNPDQLSGWVGFAGDIPDGAAALFDGIDDVEFRTGLGATEQELAEASDQLHAQLTAALGEGASVITYPDMALQRIVVEYGTDSAPESTQDQIRTALAEAAEGFGIPEGFTIDIVDIGQSVAVIPE